MKIHWHPKDGDGPHTAWTGTHLLVSYQGNAVLLKPTPAGVWQLVARAKGADGRDSAERAYRELTKPKPERKPAPRPEPDGHE